MTERMLSAQRKWRKNHNQLPNYPNRNEIYIKPPQMQYPPLKPHRQPNNKNNNRGRK